MTITNNSGQKGLDISQSAVNQVVTKRFGELAEFINGRAFGPDEWATEGLPIIRIQNLTGSSDEYNYYAGQPNERNMVRTGDLLISWSASLGAYRWNRGDAVLNQHIFKVNLHEGVDKNFFYYATQSKLLEMIGETHGSTMKHITKDRFEDLAIALPPVPVQRKIATILDKADAAREKRRQANLLTEQFLQSAFLEMFGDPVTNPKGWARTPFGHSMTSIRYATGSPPPYVEDGIPFIRATNVKGGTIVTNELKHIAPEDALGIAKCKVKPGDLILVRSGVNAGDCAIVPPSFDGAYAAYDLIIELPKSAATFYNHLINSPFGKALIEPLKRRAGQPHLNADQIKKLELPTPTSAKVDEFAALVEKVESMRAKQKESEKELENLFGSLMQRSFRGELV